MFVQLFILLTKNRTEFTAEYGGYGLKRDWRTLGRVRVYLIFENGKGYGNIMLGEKHV
ncbi:MAG: hypothetical protein JTT15_02595 [Candidatus Brockarchaeota archaeon]|nr:hypothetical protein [Candidatus Brockarchaeota archaeon]MBO3840753.1 hypothetical protein [Candidatus Brockarchaeota archaeon]